MSNERIDLTQFDWMEHHSIKFMENTGDLALVDVNAIEMIPELIAELKRCYEEMDKVTEMIADFSHHCEQAEYTDVGEVWDLLNALMKNLASE